MLSAGLEKGTTMSERARQIQLPVAKILSTNDKSKGFPALLHVS
jgi:hypothetical protein